MYRYRYYNLLVTLNKALVMRLRRMHMFKVQGTRSTLSLASHTPQSQSLYSAHL